MTIVGARGPNMYELCCGGATWSYIPPKSSQVRTIAVLLQYGLRMMALMRCTVQFSPRHILYGGCSLCVPSGVNQDTVGSCRALMSRKNAPWGRTFRCQSAES